MAVAAAVLVPVLALGARRTQPSLWRTLRKLDARDRLRFAGIAVVGTFGTTASGTGDRLLLSTALVFAAVYCEAAYSVVGKWIHLVGIALVLGGLAAVIRSGAAVN